MLSAVALVVGSAAPAPETVDLLIRGGTVYPGSDAPFVGDVAVTGDRIRFVGARAAVTARRTIDARGLVVAAGFIDPHTHLEAMFASNDARERLVLPLLIQGVTTAVVGNDGISDAAMPTLSGSTPTGINRAAYVGFGTIRRAVIGEARRRPTAAELTRMRTMVGRAMCDGALGLSAGLFYAPQSFAETAEVVALAREAGARGGLYDTHLRDESSYTVGLAEAVDEAIAIGRAAGLPVNISHIKALGVDVRGQAPAIIARVAAARTAGQRVTADQYPWAASATTLAAALAPLWAMDGGRPALLARFDDPAQAGRLRRDMADNLRRRGGAAALLIVEGAERGRTLARVATRHHDDAVAAAIATLRASDPATFSFNQDEGDIAAFMRQPWVMTGSDAFAGHPRVHGSFARKGGEYVRRGVLTFAQFVARSTALPADTLGLVDRGRLRPGAFADIVVLDAATYAARATYAAPTRFARGVRTVIVNGVVALDGGRATGRAAGRALRHAPPPGTCR